MSLVWEDKKLVARIKVACEEACREGAEAVAEDMRRKVPRKSGELASTIKTRKSKFKDGGWLAGIFHEDNAVWEETMGARAIFVEYGHAAPYQGRKYAGKKNVVKYVPAKKFIRPALRANRIKIVNNFNSKLR